MNKTPASGLEFRVRNPLGRKNLTRLVEIFDRLSRASNLGKEG
jgi:hypothetical protein